MSRVRIAVMFGLMACSAALAAFGEHSPTAYFSGLLAGLAICAGVWPARVAVVIPEEEKQ